MLQDPDQIPYVRSNLNLDEVPEPEIQAAARAIYDCADKGIPVNATSLVSCLEEKAYSLVMKVQAQNSIQRLTRKDIDMFLERLRHAVPKSKQAAQTSDEDFRKLFASITQEKVHDPPTGAP